MRGQLLILLTPAARKCNFLEFYGVRIQARMPGDVDAGNFQRIFLERQYTEFMRTGTKIEFKSADPKGATNRTQKPKKWFLTGKEFFTKIKNEQLNKNCQASRTARILKTNCRGAYRFCKKDLLTSKKNVDKGNSQSATHQDDAHPDIDLINKTEEKDFLIYSKQPMSCGFADESQKNDKGWASTDFSRVSKNNWKFGSRLNLSNVSKKFLDAQNTDFKFSVTDSLRDIKGNGRQSMHTFYKSSVNGSKQPGVTWSGPGLPGSDNSPHKVNISWNDKGFMKNNLTIRETSFSGQKKSNKYLKLSKTLGNADRRHLLRTSYKVGSNSKFGSVVYQKS